MAGAAATTFVGYRLAWRPPKPVLEARFEIPSSTTVDRPLLAGAAIFRIGWGIGGYCPGPVLAALPLHAPGTLVVVPAMLVGLWLGSHAKNLRILA